MKYIIILAIVIITFSSCNENEISGLNNQISKLKNQNAELRDSISKLELKNIYAYHILGITKQKSLKVNKETTIDFVFGYRDYIKEYDVYLLTGKKENDRELILKGQKISEFKYTYTPKNKNDNRIKLIAVFDLDSINIEIPADVTINVTD
ncbi:hypothetical protein LS482_02510 [Sinomicrobium kalidii]|uniref:hypothetical protein n=1 Tax=Sinomicrobium kalidii TaxID=2900738 RepID=UPI001E3477E5|nr:hypothetical protein [Sinomicrobium kalidii]UGU16753.1 hypothetical protein LS482_02510 [Sinomicrobium kalidii]